MRVSHFWGTTLYKYHLNRTNILEEKHDFTWIKQRRSTMELFLLATSSPLKLCGLKLRMQGLGTRVCVCHAFAALLVAPMHVVCVLPYKTALIEPVAVEAEAGLGTCTLQHPCFIFWRPGRLGFNLGPTYWEGRDVIGR